MTSFASFKFMALYSLIQFSATVILYSINSILGDFQVPGHASHERLLRYSSAWGERGFFFQRNKCSLLICGLLYRLFKHVQFLWNDLFLVLPLAFGMSRTGPHERLSIKRPTEALISWNVISSLVSQMSIHLAFQLIAFFGIIYTQQDKGW